MRALTLLLLGACASGPPVILARMDATTGVDDAVAACAKDLASRDHGERLAAAKTLGRLRRASPEAIAALDRALSPGDTVDVRSMSAWALGELRSAASLEPLVRALRTPLDPTTGHFVLEGIAKHYAVLPSDEERLVEIVEAMAYFAGNQRTEVSGMYDLLGARLRTVAVNVRVLDRAVEAVASRRSPEHMAAVYNAAFELLSRLDLSRDEIAAGAAAWSTRIDEAMRQTQRAYALQDPRLETLIVWYLGKLAVLRELGRPASDALIADGSVAGRPSASSSPAVRLVAAWMLSRMMLYGTGPKAALARDILPKEIDPAVIGTIGAASRKDGHLDLLQKVRGEP